MKHVLLFFLVLKHEELLRDKSNQTHQALSPYGTSLDCPGLDRRGHKLAMTHQRPVGHQRGAKEGPGHLVIFWLETGEDTSEGGKWAMDWKILWFFCIRSQ